MNPLNKCENQSETKEGNGPEKRRTGKKQNNPGILSGFVSIILNLALAAGKLTAGILAHSIAVSADGVNNLSDALTGGLTLLGFLLSSKKPDKEHPFGHGRLEYLTGVGISVGMIVVGFSLGRESIGQIRNPVQVSFSLFMAAVMLISAAVKTGMFLFHLRLARSTKSATFQAIADDSRNDAIATLTVLLCQLISLKTEVVLDGYAGLAVSVFILWSGVKSLSETTSPLLGAKPDPELVSLISETVLQISPVLGVHDILVHDYGPGKRMVSLDMELDSSLSLKEAHAAADQAEEAIRSGLGMEATVHMDPMDTDRRTRRVRQQLTAWLKELDPDAGFHDLHVIREEETFRLSFDAEIPFHVAETDEAICRRLEALIAASHPNYIPSIHIDRK